MCAGHIEKASQILERQNERLAAMRDQSGSDPWVRHQSQPVEVRRRLDDALNQIRAHPARIAEFIPFVTVAASKIAELR